MIALPLAGGVREVLVLGAHCDDVEIGCGGTLAMLRRAHPGIHVNVVVFSGDDVRASETRAALGRLTPDPATCTIEVHGFRDALFPMEWPHIKKRFEELKRRCNPDLVFTHHEHDRHQDHRTISELTWNTFRNHAVFEYEIPKYDGDLGRPNFFIPIPADVVEHKTDALLKCFASQAGKPWFTADLFSGLMRLRGMECNSPSGYAEAFYVRKLVGQW